MNRLNTDRRNPGQDTDRQDTDRRGRSGEDTRGAAEPPRPRSRRLRAVEVVDVQRLTPHMVSVSFTGEFDEFAINAPTQHVKIAFPSEGSHVVSVPTDGSRPLLRTYTPRRFDSAAQTLEVQFVIHGEGPASAWADRAVSGDRLALAGPGGRMPLALSSGPWVIAGDESAIPAIGTLLEALPDEVEPEVFIETRGSAIPVTATDRAITWVSRSAGEGPGVLLERALSQVEVAPGTRVWVACEATAVRRIRHSLLESGTVAPALLVTRGYWRSGEANHPDHDYGED